MLPRNPTHRVRTASRWLRCSTQVSESFSFCFLTGMRWEASGLSHFLACLARQLHRNPGKLGVRHLAFHQTRKYLMPNTYKNPIATPKGYISHTLLLSLRTTLTWIFSDPCFWHVKGEVAAQHSTSLRWQHSAHHAPPLSHPLPQPLCKQRREE